MPPQFGFLKFYVMVSPGIHLYNITHVKVDFIPLPKMYVIPRVLRKICLNYRLCTM